MMFGYKMNKFLKNNSYRKSSKKQKRSICLHPAAMANKKMDMSRVQKYFDVEKLYGNSYSYVGLSIDGHDDAINKKIKEMQEKEFREVAEIRLFNQKHHYRFKLMKERHDRTGEEFGKPVLIEDAYPDDTLEEEFQNFKLSDFMPLNYTEEELIDIIIADKMDELEENEKKTRQKRNDVVRGY